MRDHATGTLELTGPPPRPLSPVAVIAARVDLVSTPPHASETLATFGDVSHHGIRSRELSALRAAFQVGVDGAVKQECRTPASLHRSLCSSTSQPGSRRPTRPSARTSTTSRSTSSARASSSEPSHAYMAASPRQTPWR